MNDNLYRRNLVVNSIIKPLSIKRSISMEASANDLDDELVLNKMNVTQFYRQ